MITLDGEIDSCITLDNSRYSYFAGNNYLGLANHPDFVKAACKALQKYGVNFSASRQTTGTSVIHLELEKLLADFKEQEDAVVFATVLSREQVVARCSKRPLFCSFCRFTGLIPAFMTAFQKIFHPLAFYDHCNPNHLEDLLKKDRRKQTIDHHRWHFCPDGWKSLRFLIFIL